MGKTKGPYNAEFPAGSQVQIVDSELLEDFKRTWYFHHPLTDELMAYAGHLARVKSVGYYHGGDELYTLDGIPGIWHECCLLSVTSPA